MRTSFTERLGALKLAFRGRLSRLRCYDAAMNIKLRTAALAAVVAVLVLAGAHAVRAYPIPRQIHTSCPRITSFAMSDSRLGYVCADAPSVIVTEDLP